MESKGLYSGAQKNEQLCKIKTPVQKNEPRQIIKKF